LAVQEAKVSTAEEEDSRLVSESNLDGSQCRQESQRRIESVATQKLKVDRLKRNVGKIVDKIGELEVVATEQRKEIKTREDLLLEIEEERPGPTKTIGEIKEEMNKLSIGSKRKLGFL
jgi:hypothetical protein